MSTCIAMTRQQRALMACSVILKGIGISMEQPAMASSYWLSIALIQGALEVSWLQLGMMAMYWYLTDTGSVQTYCHIMRRTSGIKWTLMTATGAMHISLS